MFSIVYHLTATYLSTVFISQLRIVFSFLGVITLYPLVRSFNIDPVGSIFISAFIPLLVCSLTFLFKPIRDRHKDVSAARERSESTSRGRSYDSKILGRLLVGVVGIAVAALAAAVVSKMTDSPFAMVFAELLAGLHLISHTIGQRYRY
jgi:hypothetical protein